MKWVKDIFCGSDINMHQITGSRRITSTCTCCTGPGVPTLCQTETSAWGSRGGRWKSCTNLASAAQSGSRTSWSATSTGSHQTGSGWCHTSTSASSTHTRTPSIWESIAKKRGFTFRCVLLIQRLEIINCILLSIGLLSARQGQDTQRRDRGKDCSKAGKDAGAGPDPVVGTKRRRDHSQVHKEGSGKGKHWGERQMRYCAEHRT
jgi:hypothetical protein